MAIDIPCGSTIGARLISAGALLDFIAMNYLPESELSYEVLLFFLVQPTQRCEIKDINAKVEFKCKKCFPIIFLVIMHS